MCVCVCVCVCESSHERFFENLVHSLVVLENGNMFLQIMFFGALLSAILSTTSGAILAPATVIGENLIKPYFKKINSLKLRFGHEGDIL